DTYPQLKQKLAPVKPSCDADAQPRRITAYAQLFTAQNIKTALLEVGAVPAVFTLYDSFSTAWTDGIVPIPNPAKEGWVGSHMMLIIGWKKIGGAERWIVLNSWGQWWGDGGLCYIPVNGYSFDEAWSLTDEIYPASQDVIKTIQFSVEPELANQVTLDGVSFDLPTGIQMKNDRIMVPLRFFSESLGCFVKWDAAEKKITITTAGGEADSGGGATEIIMTIGESSYTLNGEPREMDVEPFIVDSGYTLVPLRAVTENLDCTVEWDAGTREATVTRK
ncbi:MAG: stalk domain-containing protein, partial [Defluviitaleaceae bacterium]|nr:stalk domain-containing protein [Defluviitaleaceae bacterium]